MIMILAITFSFAQNNIAIDISSFNLTGTTNDFTVEGLSYVSNNTGMAQNLRWQRVVESAPSAWSTMVCDQNACYGPSTSTMDFTLTDGGSGLLKLDVTPNSTAGTGVYKMYVWSPTDSANINGVITYNVTITQFNTITTVSNFQGVGLFPNPAKNILKVTTGSDVSVSRIEVYNLLGDKMNATFTSTGLNEYSVNVAGLMNGTYFIHIIMKDGSLVTRKFSKN